MSSIGNLDLDKLQLTQFFCFYLSILLDPADNWILLHFQIMTYETRFNSILSSGRVPVVPYESAVVP